MKAGFVAILGRPNVGKSTLVNALLSKKVSIVSPRAQTTRDAVMGILNEKDLQIVFVDTPGIHHGGMKLDSKMRRSAFASSRDVDCVVYLIDGACKDIEEDVKIAKSISTDAPFIFVLNKIDRITPVIAEEKKKIIAEAFPDALLLEASLIENFGIKEIKDAVLPYMTSPMAFFPEDSITDKDKAFQAKEVIREKMLHFLRDEVPHSAAVKIDRLIHKDDAILLEATIFVDRVSHKGIVIGKNGQMIKKISMAARQELTRMWHERISSLRIEVDVAEGWRDSAKVLSSLGYGEE